MVKYVVIDPMHGFKKMKATPSATCLIVERGQQIGYKMPVTRHYYYLHGGNLSGQLESRVPISKWKNGSYLLVVGLPFSVCSQQGPETLKLTLDFYDKRWMGEIRVDTQELCFYGKWERVVFRVCDGVVTARKSTGEFVEVEAENFKKIYKLMSLAQQWALKNQARLYSGKGEDLPLSPDEAKAFDEAFIACWDGGILEDESLLIKK